MGTTRRSADRPAAEPQQAFVELLRAHDHVMTAFGDVFAGHGITEPQYNVLRILRGAGGAGLPCRVVGERMLARVPDVTRLLDRLETAGLVRRERDATDRRVVLTHLTEKGASLLRRLDAPVREAHRRQFAALTGKELERLVRLLRRVRGAGAGRRKTTEVLS